MPFTPRQVLPLTDWDYQHFIGSHGTGGHSAQSSVVGASRFPGCVRTLRDLQAVQDAAMVAVQTVRRGRLGRYEMRSLVDHEGFVMVVHTVVDPYREPVTIYPINGESVTRLRPNKQVIEVPLDLRALLKWMP